MIDQAFACGPAAMGAPCAPVLEIVQPRFPGVALPQQKFAPTVHIVRR